MRLLNRVRPTKPSPPVYHSPPRSKLLEMYGVRSGLPWLATCADWSVKVVAGSIELGFGRVMVREPDMRRTTLSATSHAALNDGSHSLYSPLSDCHWRTPPRVTGPATFCSVST